jgi:hypothetical protein
MLGRRFSFFIRVWCSGNGARLRGAPIGRSVCCSAGRRPQHFRVGRPNKAKPFPFCLLFFSVNLFIFKNLFKFKKCSIRKSAFEQNWVWTNSNLNKIEFEQIQIWTKFESEQIRVWTNLNLNKFEFEHFFWIWIWNSKVNKFSIWIVFQKWNFRIWVFFISPNISKIIEKGNKRKRKKHAILGRPTR